MTEYAVQSNYIRHLTAKQFGWLKEMCRISNNLYNEGLYQTRQHFFTQHSMLTYESNYFLCKNDENYKLLQAAISQHTLKVVARSFRSFLALLKKCKKGDYRYQDVEMPHYRKRGGLFLLILPVNAISIRNGMFKMPVSRRFRETHSDYEDIRIPFPKRLEGKTIKEIRILPVNNGRCFKIQYVYVVKQESKNLDKTNVMGIDLGIDNLATCVTEETSFIIDGRKLKSINRLWNKRVATLKSQLDKQYHDGKSHTSRQIQTLTDKRNRRVHDYMLKAARRIVDYCILNDIGCVIIGVNQGWKQSIKLGKRNTQNFVDIPFWQLRDQLSFLCWKYDIEYIEQEESYTSKASYLDDDVIPIFGRGESSDNISFSGKRVKRGLYKTANGTLINADVNGAANIARKCKQELGNKRLSRGLLASPHRMSVETDTR